MNQFEDKLNLIEKFCRENKFIYDRQSFLLLLQELDEYVQKMIDKAFLERLNKTFSIQKNNIASLIRLILDPIKFREEDPLGFYYTINNYIKGIFDNLYSGHELSEIDTVSPTLYEVCKQIQTFDNNFPIELRAKYGLSCRNIIINFIIYNTYFVHQENIDDILLDVINNHDMIIDRLRIQGLNDYFHINHDFNLLKNYYLFLEMIFNSYTNNNYIHIK